MSVESPEYLLHRCCMCPNVEEASSICPGIEGTPHPEASVCRFVKSYSYSENVGIIVFVARVALPGKESEWAIFRKWRNSDATTVFSSLMTGILSFDKAQAFLNELAQERGWQPMDEQTCRVCGCTEDRACPSGCYWVEEDLCSRCAEEVGL